MTCSDEVLTVKMLLLRKFSRAEKFTTDARRVFANWKTILLGYVMLYWVSSGQRSL